MNIHLSRDNYRVFGDLVQVWDEDPNWTPSKFLTEFDEFGDGHTYPDPYEFSYYVWRDTKYRVGAVVILCSNVSPNAIRNGHDNPVFRLVFDCPDGIPGNSNRNIKRFHGWRGTNNDVSNYAYGMRKIIKIRTMKNGDIAVTVGPDIMPDAD
jgi:hypothetical protein